MGEVEELTIRRVTDPTTGRVYVLRDDDGEPWPSHIGVAEELLEAAASGEWPGLGEALSAGDGLVTFVLSGERALYGYAHAGSPEYEPGAHYNLIRAERLERSRYRAADDGDGEGEADG